MSRYLLDTSAFLKASIYPQLLSKEAERLMSNNANLLTMSTISLVEIAILISSKRIELDELSLRSAVEDLSITTIPFFPRHAQRYFSLPLHHRDPFDRMIIATAMEEKVPVITSDRAFHFYSVETIW